MRMAITPEDVTLEAIERVCEKPIDALQLRRKKLEAKALHSFALATRAITEKKKILLIINERVDIALSVGADGVHLPQRSLPPSAVRHISPTDFLIGVSTHSFAQAIRAEKEHATYLTYSSPIKGEPPDCVELKKFTDHLSIPLLALGNVNESNLSSYLESGACGYAAIRMYFDK